MLLIAITGLLLAHPRWLGPGEIETTALAADPDRSARWLRGTELGLEVSEDDGRTWREAPMLAPPGTIIRIAFAPDEPSRVYVLGSDGLVSAEDGGRIWAAIAWPESLLTPWPELRDLALGTGGRVRVLTDAGILASADHGVSWRWSSVGSPGNADRLRDAIHRLHTGYWLGESGLLINDLMALVLVILTASGLVMLARPSRRNGRR